MANEIENMNLRKRIEEELRKMGISTENLSDDEIGDMIQKKILTIGNQIEKQVASAVQNIGNKVRERTKKQSDQQILDLLLAGKTPEEIYEDKQFRGYSLDDIKEIESRNLSRILALKLLPVRDISNILGVRVQTVYSNLRNKTYKGKSILAIIKEKEAEVERRLEEGQSIDEIAGDRELNVDAEAVKYIQGRQQRRKERKVVAIKNEEEEQILSLLLEGKTPEEISMFEQFKDYPLDSILLIEERNRLRILAMQLMPLDEIEKRTGRRVVSIQQNISKYQIDGKSLAQIRKEKEEEVIRRLNEGQSIDEILEDKELNVCREGIESIQTKQSTITWRQAVLEELLAGKTPEEISQMEQFEGHTVEEVQRILSKNMLRIQAIQLVPVQELANRFGRKEKSVRVNLRNFEVNGRSISQIRREKETEIEKRLGEGQSVDDILADRELNVCREGIESVQARLGKKQSKAKKITRAERQKIVGYLLLGKTTEEIQNLDEFRAFSLSDIEVIRQQNEARILASQLMPIREISNMVGVQVNSVYTNIRDFKIDGVSLSEIRRKKELEVERRLKEGQSIDEILSDTELNVCRQGIEGILFKIEKKKKKGSITAKQTEELASDEEQRQSKEQIEAHRSLEIMREKYRELSENQNDSSVESDKSKSGEEKPNVAIDDIPEEVQSIIAGIACGDLDVDSAKEVIANLASKKVKGRGQVKFGLTEKQEKHLIISQIRKVLAEQGEEYPIDNPEKTILILQELSKSSLTPNLNTVVKNQLARRKFDEAEQLCDEYGVIKKDNIPITAYIRGLRRIVRNARVGDLVYRTINSEVSPEDETKFWKLLQEGLKMGHVRREDVILEKSKDGSRKISLDDVWPENSNERSI